MAKPKTSTTKRSPSQSLAWGVRDVYASQKKLALERRLYVLKEQLQAAICRTQSLLHVQGLLMEGDDSADVDLSAAVSHESTIRVALSRVQVLLRQLARRTPEEMAFLADCPISTVPKDRHVVVALVLADLVQLANPSPHGTIALRTAAGTALHDNPYWLPEVPEDLP